MIDVSNIFLPHPNPPDRCRFFTIGFYAGLGRQGRKVDKGV
jgi:hypothetical protein